MSCKRITNTNGEVSVLFDKLYDIVNDENKADELYAYFSTDEFIDLFGDYNNITENFANRLDINGEPLLILDNNLSKYYFLDKYNEKVYYPYSKTGLNSLFPTNDIKNFSKSLALNYYKDNIKLDFDNLSFINEKGVELSNYISTKLDFVIEDLINSDDIDYNIKAIALKQSKNYLNEWLKEVTSFYSTLKIEYNEESIIEQEENHNDDLVRKESFLKDSKSNVRNNIKLFLSVIEDNKVDDFNQINFIDFDDIYSTLNKSLVDVVPLENEDIYDVYLNIINNLSDRKPYFKNLYDYLSSDLISEVFKNQFVAAFNLSKKNFLGTEIEQNDDGKSYTIKNLSEVNSRENTILNEYLYNYNNLNVNKKNIIKRVNGGISLINKDFNNIKTDEDLVAPLNAVKDILNNIGVEFSKEAFDYYLSDFSLSNQSINRKKQSLLNTLDAIKRALNDNSDNLFKSQSVFKSIAKAESFFMKEGSDASMFSIGKTKWIYSLPSYIDLKVNKWKKNPNSLLDLYNSSLFHKSSYYMEYLLALDVEEDLRKETSKKRINNIEVGVFNSFQNKLDSTNAVDNKNISYTDSLVDYINKVLAYKNNNKVYYKTALAGDKSTEYQINYGNISVNSNATKNNDKINIDDNILEIFYNYFKSDYDSVNYELNRLNNGEQPIPNYTDNLLNNKSILFPSLSNNSEIELYDNQGNPIYQDLNQIKDQIKEIISNKISDNIKDTGRLLKSQKIFDNNLIDNNIKGTALELTADFYINSVISTIEYAKIFTGDVAYYKNLIDYKKRVPGTYTDGIYPRISKDNKEFKVAILPTIEVDLSTDKKFKDLLQPEVYKQYANINTTDAQAWITPERWSSIMKSIGKWDNNTQTIYDKFYDSKPVFTSKELKTLAQPLKGVYFNVESNGRPIYLKYSQAVLLPNLIEGTELEDIYNKMFDNGIDELIAQDGIKVGSPLLNEDFIKNSITLDNSYWKLQQQLPTKNIKDTDMASQIQKNIFFGLVHNLDKEFKVEDETFTGDELIDHINSLFDSLSTKGKYEVANLLGINPDTLKIENEDKLYNTLIKQLNKRNDIPDNFIKSLEAGLSPYGIPGFFEIFQNVFSSFVNKRISKYQTNGGEFIQMSDYGITRNEANKEGILWNPKYNDEKPMPPRYNEDGSIEPGGILLSGSFISKYIPNYKDISQEELFNKYIDSRILDNIIGYRIPNQGLASNDALKVIGILPEETGNTIVPYIGATTKTGSDFDIDKMYIMMPYFKPVYKNKSQAYKYIKDNDLSIQEIKDELVEIGYSHIDQISNKDAIDYFVEDILLQDTGESAYSEDFKTNSKLNSPILKYIESEKDLPLHERSKKSIANDIIQAYKAVLLNSSTINDVMNPIDIKYIEEDIKSLYIEHKISDLDAFDGIKDIEYRQQYKLGKAGLGQNINSLVDSVRGSMANITLNQYLGMGNSNNDGVTIFDKEYSEELKELENNSKIKIADTLNAMVNGFVDIAKDPYIVKGNWVTQTNAIGFLLIRAGVHPFKVNAFIAQPVIKDYVKFRNLMESKSIASTSNLDDRFKLELAKKEFKSYNINNTNEIFNNIVSLDNLNLIKKGTFNPKNNDILKALQVVFQPEIINPSEMSLKTLRSQIKDSSDVNTQVNILNYFIELKTPAKALTKSVNASKIDVNGKGKNISSIISSLNLIKNLEVNENINGFNTKLTRSNKNTLLGSVKQNNIDYILDVMSANPKYFYSANKSSIETFNQISNFIYGELLDNTILADKIGKDYNHYILSGFKPLVLSKNEVNNLFNTLPNTLAKYKKETDNFLVQELNINNGSIIMPNVKKSVFFKNQVVDSWNELLETDKKFAEDLIKYSFYLTGFNNSLNSFHEYIPYNWFNQNRFNSYLKELSNKEVYIEENFIDQFFKNNYNDKSIVPKIFKNKMNALQGDTAFLTGFITNEKNPNYMYEYEVKDENAIYKRYYKAQGIYPDGSTLFLRTSVLSIKDKNTNFTSKEYNINTNETSRSSENTLKTNQLNMNIYNSYKNDERLNSLYKSEGSNTSIQEDPTENEC